MLQLCPTLCIPIDGSPPGSPIPGILQARILEWVTISFSNAWKWKVKVKSLSCVWLFSILKSRDVTNKGPSSQSYEKAMATHSSTLAWKIPWTEEPGRLQSMGLLRVGHDWANSLSIFTFMHWRRKWQPSPVFLPGESQGQRSLVGCCLWGRTESDTTEAPQQQQQPQGSKIPCAIEQLILRAATKRAHIAQPRSYAAGIKKNNNNKRNLVSEENIIWRKSRK